MKTEKFLNMYTFVSRTMKNEDGFLLSILQHSPELSSNPSSLGLFEVFKKLSVYGLIGSLLIRAARTKRACLKPP